MSACVCEKDYVDLSMDHNQIAFEEFLYNSLDEEDKILYKHFIELGIDLTNHCLQWQKHNIKVLVFPPLTAPSFIRKTFREMLDNVSQTDRFQLGHDIIEICITLKSQNSNLTDEMKKSNFSYPNFIDTMLNMAASINPYDCFYNYALLNNFLINYKKELLNILN